MGPCPGHLLQEDLISQWKSEQINMSTLISSHNFPPDATLALKNGEVTTFLQSPMIVLLLAHFHSFLGVLPPLSAL